MILLGARRRRRVRPSLLVALGLAGVVGALGVPSWRPTSSTASFLEASSLRALWSPGEAPVQRVLDEVKILPPGVRQNAERYLSEIFSESDVDFRILLTRTGDGDDLEIVASERMRELGAGASTSGERGLLLVYDATSQRGRIEVGYGLEEHFPDGFVGYLLSRHVAKLFEVGDTEQAVQFLLRIMHHRIREAVLDRRFDPRVLDALGGGHLSGGAGAARALPLAQAAAMPVAAAGDEPPSSRLGPQVSPEDAYRAYLSWLQAGRFDFEVGVLTPETRDYLARFPMTPAYFDYILLQEYGHDYAMLTRGDLAMLVFRSSPLVSPHFFRRGPDGWQIDLVAEVANTANITGGVYVWTYRGRDDAYSNRFADELIKIGNYMRLVHGDNRMLPLSDPDNDPTTGLVRVALDAPLEAGTGKGESSSPAGP